MRNYTRERYVIQNTVKKLGEGIAGRVASEGKPLLIKNTRKVGFWLYDRSSGQQRTQKLIDKSLGLVVSLIRISGLPLMRPMRKTVLELVETVTP